MTSTPVLSPPPSVVPPLVTTPPPPPYVPPTPKRSGGGGTFLVVALTVLGMFMGAAAGASQQLGLLVASAGIMALAIATAIVLAFRRTENSFGSVVMVLVVVALVAATLVPAANRVIRCRPASGADLTMCDFSEENLSGKDLSDVKLTKVDLRNADLSGTVLAGASLARADLQRANLTDADLTGADLTRTNLRGANLTGADLAGATLDGTSFIKARGLTDAMLASAFGLPGSKVADAAIENELRFEGLGSIAAALGDVSKGNGVPEAAPYSASSAFHPIVVLADSKKTVVPSWFTKARGIWSAPGLRFTELVAFESSSSRLIQKCEFTLHPIRRLQSVLTIEILEAKTGRFVAGKTFYGSMPRMCQFTESASTYTISGSVANYKGDLLPWLERIVNPLPGK